MYYFKLVYGIVNFYVLMLYGIDKYKAIKQHWRIAERRLLQASVLGPFGAFLGMVLFRHKVNKLRFKLVVVTLMLVHLAGLWLLQLSTGY